MCLKHFSGCEEGWVTEQQSPVLSVSNIQTVHTYKQAPDYPSRTNDEYFPSGMCQYNLFPPEFMIKLDIGFETLA